MLSRKILDAKKFLSKVKEIELAFLFGSEASGRSRITSDVDVAILLKKEPSVSKRIKLKLDISEKLSDIFKKEIDLVIINTSGSILKYQIVKDGKLIFEKRKGVALKFRLAALNEYFDYLPTFNFHYERLRRQSHGKHCIGKKTVKRPSRKKKGS